MTNARRCFPAVVTILLSVSLTVRAQAAPPSTPAIAAALQPFVDNHTLAGAVTLVADKDRVLSLDAVGCMDIDAKTPMRTDCLFWIASMSKPMTAAAVMMLVDEGRVSLDDPVEKYLPEFQGQMLAVQRDDAHMLLKRPAHPITVREVLSHTSGLPFMSRIEHKIDSFTLHEAAISYAMTPLEYQPGTRARLQQRRHQHGRPDHRSRQRYALRGVHGEASLPAAGDERHDLLAEPGSNCRGWPSPTGPKVRSRRWRKQQSVN